MTKTIHIDQIENPSLIDVARSYGDRGFWVVPVPFMEKGPIIKRWPNLRIESKGLPKYFNGTPQNMGVLLGISPAFLADIDLDSELAVKMAELFLPGTNAIFGRIGNKCSHYLYSAYFPGTEKFTDPFETEKKAATIVEIRGKGSQTIFPPSTHHSGESIVWYSMGIPQPVEPMNLRRAVALLASACVVRRFWQVGTRHDLSLAVAGALLKNGFTENEVGGFIRAVCIAADDHELDDRLLAVKTTAERILRNEPVSGLAKIGEITNSKLVKVIVKWLELRDSKSSLKAASPARRVSKSFFDLTPLNEFLAEPEEIESFLWDQTLPTGGFSINSAKPKVGKSTFARNLAKAVISGSAFLGRSTQKGRVIYLSLEEKRSELAKQFKQMGLSHGDIWIHTGHHLSSHLKRWKS